MKMNDVCEERCIHEDTVRKVKEEMLPDEVFNHVSDDFKVLGDRTRVKMLFALSQEELCVCDLSNILGLSESAISHQLRQLRNRNMVKYRREGKMAYYSLADQHVVQFLKMGVEHARE
ncbi:winged helix-turn-helix transcriptional regulator [Methanobacterium sp. CWC-01]|jgi:ArsR family transcriptional regulator, lead/cadmium/zinc/bismuth-responsive transcriptional repressor|uniref:ArsR/SmtB family transcription factor n=1 Tax=Methanobacterium aridiramus TaxID=2584467 RepID=UPI002578078E|nr:metalloregulator ArsR/SmtB family transcription factor [Methanobacterium sp. CWC-01]WJI09270.1 winged helix-turn-helix transcriptional regulator [Methanobacterium sp. CWC-01]